MRFARTCLVQVAVVCQLFVHSPNLHALPDLIVHGDAAEPEVVQRSFEENDCAVLEGCAASGDRRLIIFSTEVRNLGPDDVVLGNPIGNTNFVFDACHGHFHFTGYAGYRLLDTNGVDVAQGGKIGFCIEDVYRWDTNAPAASEYHCGNQGLQAGWADVYSPVLDCQWIDVTDVLPGTYLLELEANPDHRIAEANTNNNTALIEVVIPEATTVIIDSPTNGTVSVDRFVTVTGTTVGTNDVTSLVVTNARGGSVEAIVEGTNWTADNVLLKLGTNVLFAIVRDEFLNIDADSVTVIHTSTNLAGTTFQTTQATLTRTGEPGGDSVSVAGTFNDHGFAFDPLSNTVEFVFGDFEGALPPGALGNGKFKGAVSPPNNLTGVKLNLARHTVQFSAAGLTLGNLDPFLVAMALGTNVLGPDSITFPVPTNATGKFTWKLGKQLSNTDQFLLTRGSFTTSSFQMSGTLNSLSKPGLLTEIVCFGIGLRYEETLPVEGWSQSGPNAYSYQRPDGHEGGMQSMTINFDRGTWSARATDIDLSFLLMDTEMQIQIEVGDFAAILSVSVTPSGSKYKY